MVQPYCTLVIERFLITSIHNTGLVWLIHCFIASHLLLLLSLKRILLQRLEKDFSRVLAIQNGVSENEGRDKLANQVSEYQNSSFRIQMHCTDSAWFRFHQAQQSTAEFVEIMDGLLYGILTDASAAEKVRNWFIAQLIALFSWRRELTDHGDEWPSATFFAFS